MADQRTVGTGPNHQRDAARGQQPGAPPAADDVGVYGGALFERHSGPGKSVIRLYGDLDHAAAGMLDQEEVVAAMESTSEVCLDMTGVTTAQPAALKLFLSRQQAGMRLAQHLSIRITPDQARDLFPAA